MKDDFEMIIHHFPERKDITIIPIADVHLGAAECMEREWRQFCDMVLKRPDIYILLGGDLVNNSTRSSIANPFDEKIRPSMQKRLMVELLTPLRSRVLGACSGNHERRSLKESDVDITYDIMTKLDIEELYRPNIAFIKIQIGDIDRDGRRNPTYSIVMTHGTGGGIYTGASVNRSERFGYVIDGMDVLVTGHTHKAFTTQPAKIFIDKHNNKVDFKPFKVVNCTSWLQYGGYATQKMLLPSSHALQTIHLNGKKKEIVVTM